MFSFIYSTKWEGNRMPALGHFTLFIFNCFAINSLVMYIYRVSTSFPCIYGTTFKSTLPNIVSSLLTSAQTPFLFLTVPSQVQILPFFP